MCSQFGDEDKRSLNTLIHHTIFLDKIQHLIYQKYLELTDCNSYSLNDQQLLRTLFAICLIKQVPFEQVIVEFLSNRKSQCIDLFVLNATTQTEPSSRLLIFFRTIFNTLEIVYNLYNSTNELDAASISDQISALTIDYAFLNRTEQKLLNELFIEFRIEDFIRCDSDLNQRIEQGTFGWFEEIRQSSSDCIQRYLQTTSIDNLYESYDRVRDYFDEKETLILKSHYYEVICKRRIDFWDYFLSSPFDAAWKHFLDGTILRLFTNLKNKIQYLNEEEDAILNVFEYIWSNDLNENLNEMHKKYCGTTERIIELINQINEEFSYLLDRFLLTNRNRKDVIHTSSKFKSYFYDTFKARNDEFLNYVEQLVNSNSLTKEQNFNLAHLMRMLILICPNYKQCFDILNLQSWFRTKDVLLNLSYVGYNCYINHVIDDLVQLFYEELDRNQPLNCLHTSANWLEIEIKERIDDGKEVSTKIYIPKQVSLPLENLLTSLTIRLCRLSGHTLPNKLKLMVLDELTRNLCAGYRKIYDNMQRKNEQSLKTTQTLQIYVDLVFLKSLLYHSVSDEQLKSELQHVLDQFQQQIDPFDLHLFSPYIQSNVEQNKLSLSMILNYLLPANLQIMLSTADLVCAKERNFKLKFNLL